MNIPASLDSNSEYPAKFIVPREDYGQWIRSKKAEFFASFMMLPTRVAEPRTQGYYAYPSEKT